MYFLVMTVSDFYQRAARWILKKHRERPVVNTGLMICALCWYAVGIPWLLEPHFSFMTTFFVLMIPLAPLFNLLQGRPMISFSLERPLGSHQQEKTDAEKKAELQRILRDSPEWEKETADRESIKKPKT